MMDSDMPVFAKVLIALSAVVGLAVAGRHIATRANARAAECAKATPEERIRLRCDTSSYRRSLHSPYSGRAITGGGPDVGK
jgi:hypothetical protein